MATHDHTPPAPIELDEAAHVLLSGMRAIAVGRGECPALRRRFSELCGPSGDEALNVLFVFMKQLAFCGRRRLRVHMPGCCAVSSDELIFLSAIAAAQEGAGAGDGGDRRWLSSLTGEEADQALAKARRQWRGKLPEEPSAL